MTNIPKNQQVKNEKDLQNVITSAILRQRGEFTREDICCKVEEDIKFSTFGKNGKGRKYVDVKQKIDDTINILSATLIIKNCKDGKFLLNKMFTF